MLHFAIWHLLQGGYSGKQCLYGQGSSAGAACTAKIWLTPGLESRPWARAGRQGRRSPRAGQGPILTCPSRQRDQARRSRRPRRRRQSAVGSPAAAPAPAGRTGLPCARPKAPANPKNFTASATVNATVQQHNRPEQASKIYTCVCTSEPSSGKQPRYCKSKSYLARQESGQEACSLAGRG